MKFLFITLVCCLLFFPSKALSAHGVSIDGTLKYPPDFKHFAYTSPESVKGGQLVLHDLGSFDKMNPFTLKGSPPFGLETFVFETLAVASLDEPFAEYGLIAKDISLAPDKKSVTFTLNEQARFSDGTPVTVEDVEYSLTTLKSDKAHPFYQIYFQDITGSDILDERRIRFNFAQPNRELHMIASQLPVLSKAYYTKNGFTPLSGKEALQTPIGSGPYLITAVNQGKSITYTRNPDYWGLNHPTRKFIFNFDTITIKSFKDQIVSVEAFKAGEFDFMNVNIAKQWQRDLAGRRFESGELLKKRFPHKNNAGMQGFVFNTRRNIFTDPQVRQAIGLALDFEWTNKTLFFDQYTRCNSYFSNSYLAATGVPQGDELALLEPYRAQLPAAVFTSPLQATTTTPPNSLRGNLRQAKKILQQAGWSIKDGVLKNKEDQSLTFEILLVSPSFERVMAPFVRNLQKLGIKATYRTIDAALYGERVKNFDFDMIVSVYGQSQSPGNEQRDYWSSSSAARKGSRNFAGVNEPVIDALVEKIVYAQTQEELTQVSHALDRVLWYGYYVVPNWYLAAHRLAYSGKFSQPVTLPLYYNPYQLLYTWWIKPADKTSGQ